MTTCTASGKVALEFSPQPLCSTNLEPMTLNQSIPYSGGLWLYRRVLTIDWESLWMVLYEVEATALVPRRTQVTAMYRFDVVIKHDTD